MRVRRGPARPDGVRSSVNGPPSGAWGAAPVPGAGDRHVEGELVCVRHRCLQSVCPSAFVACVWFTNRCRVCLKPSVLTWPARSENPKGPFPPKLLTLRHLPAVPVCRAVGLLGSARLSAGPSGTGPHVMPTPSSPELWPPSLGWPDRPAVGRASVESMVTTHRAPAAGVTTALGGAAWDEGSPGPSPTGKPPGGSGVRSRARLTLP